MSASSYKKILTKSLKEASTRKFRSEEELAGFLVERMNVFDEMRSMMTDDVVCTHTPQPEPALPMASDPEQRLIIPATTIPDKMPPRADISERIMPAKVNYSDEEIIALKQKAVNYYQRELPLELKIELEGAKAPLVLRRAIRNTPGAMPGIKVGYSPNGTDDGLPVVVDVTQPLTLAENVLTEIDTMAKSWFSAKPKAITANLPPAISLEAQLAGEKPVSGEMVQASAEERSAFTPSAADLANFQRR